MLRIFWFTGGILALAAGTLGIFLPLLPTVPFILLAAALFAKSSVTFHNYLLRHRLFGPMIKDWQANRKIPRNAIAAKIIVMTISIAVWLLYLNNN